ncbi:hypothetical protein [Pseudomonas fluorescens]|uniref:Uncharacterized protein n=1 Tax=Pseudomonas fluorescens TaxID=294 RepID=A0A5E7EFQ6_PSEFL|nr:hypothetical protein [Pseudomonas fluorescens]VVO25656.1 hypothetical protein PS723_04574 [Pseudomonas fluorescens]
MRYKIFDIPKGYVPSVFEIIFLIIILMYFSVVSLCHFEEVVEIPSVPKKLVLESAFIYRDISRVSKTTSNLYLRVGPGDEAYDHVIEASTREVQHLGFSKSRKLWVAVEPDRSKRFVWGVYDNDLRLLISRQDILQWAQYSNSANYFVIVTWGFLSLYLLFVLLKHGVWNGFLAKRIAREDRAD